MPDRRAALAALEAIFFASALRRRFADDAERAAFLETWTGWYVREAPEDVLFWVDADGDPGGGPCGGIAGYLTGCRDSAGAAALFDTILGYGVFADRFARFPAHLHVNVRPDRRDAGIGARLIDAFARDCGTGLHIVTGSGARNAGFYRRNGFTVEETRGPLHFMGRDA